MGQEYHTPETRNVLSGRDVSCLFIILRHRVKVASFERIISFRHCIIILWRHLCAALFVRVSVHCIQAACSALLHAQSWIFLEKAKCVTHGPRNVGLYEEY